MRCSVSRSCLSVTWFSCWVSFDMRLSGIRLFWNRYCHAYSLPATHISRLSPGFKQLTADAISEISYRLRKMYRLSGLYPIKHFDLAYWLSVTSDHVITFNNLSNFSRSMYIGPLPCLNDQSRRYKFAASSKAGTRTLQRKNFLRTLFHIRILKEFSRVSHIFPVERMIQSSSSHNDSVRIRKSFHSSVILSPWISSSIGRIWAAVRNGAST